MTLEHAYLNYLMNQTSHLLSTEDNYEETAFYQETAAIYEGSIVDPLAEMLDNYTAAAYTNALIESSDYYASDYFIEQAEVLLDILEERESEGYIELHKSMDVDDLIDTLDSIEDQREKPNNFISASLGFTTAVSSNDLAKAMSILANVGKSDIKDAIDAKDVPAFNTTINTKVEDIKAGGTPYKEHSNMVSVSPEELTLNQKAKNSKLQEDLISDITSGQWVGSNLTPVDKQFDKILFAISYALNKYGEDMTSNEIEDINDFLNENLETILGDKKEEFIKVALQTNASELLDRLEKWSRTSDYFEDYVFDIEELIPLVIALGIDIEPLHQETKSDEPEQSTEAETPADTQEIIPTIRVSDWQPYKDQEVLYVVEGTPDNYTFEWYSGVPSSSWLSSDSTPEYTFTYDAPGDYDCQVKVYDANKNLIDTLTCSIQVTEGVDVAEVLEEIEYYDDGSIHKIYHYIQHSGWRTYVGSWQVFATNGNLITAYNYNDSQELDGLYCEYYVENGNLKVEKTYVNGLIEGHDYTYYQSGEIYTDTIYVNGLKEGYYVEYTSSGAVSKEGYYSNDFQDGTWTSYHVDSSSEPGENPVWGITVYNLGLTVDNKGYHWEGYLTNHRTYIDGVWYEYTVYNEDGSIYFHEFNEDF